MSEALAVPGAEREPVGIIGLGLMGGAMASRLLAAGFPVTGHDIDAQALDRFVRLAGRRAATPADAARGAGLLIVMVHDSAQAESVLFGPEGAVAVLPRCGAVWLASTVEPSYARRLGERLHAGGLHFIDGPVSGGLAGAEAGELAVMAGCSDAALARCHDLMSACASRVHHVGDVGTGSTMKMINQLLVASHVALAAEALAFGVRAGVGPRQLIEVIGSSAGNSTMFEKRAPRMAAGDHEPHATLATLLKDLRIGLDAARSLAFPTPIAASAYEVFATAAHACHAEASDTMVVRFYEQLGGVDVAGAWR